LAAACKPDFKEVRNQAGALGCRPFSLPDSKAALRPRPDASAAFVQLSAQLRVDFCKKAVFGEEKPLISS